jgi:hypothetical protein
VMKASNSFDVVGSMYRFIRCQNLEDHKWVKIGVNWMLGSQENSRKIKMTRKMGLRKQRWNGESVYFLDEFA